jgi:hypothetical protein
MRTLLARAIVLTGLALLGLPPAAPAGEGVPLPPPHLVPRSGIVHVGALPPASPDPARVAAATLPGDREAPLAVTVLRQFEGLDNADNVAFGGGPTVPPDQNLGVGPSQIFEMVNTTGRVFSKSTAGIQATFSLRSFFGVAAGLDESHPHVVFDVLSGRWFAVYLEFKTTLPERSSIILAVSATNDARGTFCTYRLGNPTTETFLQDFPTLGLSNDKVVVAYNAIQFPLATQTALGAGYYAVNKSDLLLCNPALQVQRVPPDPTRSSPWPSLAQTNTNQVFLAMSGFQALRVVTLTGIPGIGGVFEASRTLTVRDWDPPEDAQQLGSPILLETGDIRVRSAVWRSNSLWVAGNEGCEPPGDLVTRSCLRVIELRTDTGTIRQDLTFAGAAGDYFYYPAAAPDAGNNLFVVFTASSNTAFPEARVTSRLATDPLNTLQPPTLIQIGVAAQTISARMGEYSGAAIDPSDPSTVWVAGEYIKTTGGDWGTWIAQIEASGPPGPGLFLGGVFAAAGDVDGAPGDEIITGPDAGGTDSLVKVFDADGTQVGTGFAPYPGFTGGVRVAACDFDGDGRAEIVTGAGPGGGPHVKAIHLDTAATPLAELVSIFPYPPGFTGGAFVACGNVEGTPGTMNLVTGTGAGGGPHLRLFRYNPAAPGGLDAVLDDFVYPPGFLGGVRVAAADVDGSGQASIIVAPGAGGGPHVRVFKLVGGALTETAGFFAYNAGFTGGVYVAAGDLDGDGLAEIVTGAGPGGGPHVRSFTGAGASIGLELLPYDPGFLGGVRVAVGDVAAAGASEIVTAPGPGGGPEIRVFTGAGTLVGGGFFAY